MKPWLKRNWLRRLQLWWLERKLDRNGYLAGRDAVRHEWLKYGDAKVGDVAPDGSVRKSDGRYTAGY